MTTTTTIRSRGAIALGILFALGTACVLFWDVRDPADVTTDHVLTLGTLFGTIAAGHYVVPAVRQGRILAALGLAIAFCAGTFICVTGSAGRGAEVIQHKAAEASRINDGRKDVEEELKKARADRSELTRRFAAECSTGKGSKCAGIKTTIDYADSHIAILQVRYDNMKPEQLANVRLKAAARVVAIVGGDEKRIEAALELLWPFANALIWELLTIVFLSLGLGHDKKTPSRPDQEVVAVAPSRDDPVIVALKKARRPVTNDELAALMGVNKDVASKRVRALNGAVQKVRHGRHVAISLLR
jgi:hypothetical protein